jgi:hypothetical protein
MDAEPNIDCWICNGTGDRPGWVYYENGQRKFTDEWSQHCNGSNACQGKGKVRPTNTFYPFRVKNVKEFAEFCRHSGGFEIW